MSIDYIYGVNTNKEALEKDIDTILSLDIPHISTYSLIIEDGTILKIKNKQYIDENIEKEMYEQIEKKLEQNNYIHYEISNYAKKGYQSIHNLNYWNNGEYYGFGLGAVSYINKERITNTKNLTKYIEGKYLYQKEKENKEKELSNTLILGLRKLEGIPLNTLTKDYEKDIIKHYHLEPLIKQGLLEIKNNYLRIPKKYIYISNNILIYFI